jgi:hypothetical protein
MKFWIVLFLFFLSGAASALDLEWLQGHWRGCEDGFLHEKVMTSAHGGSVIGACKLLKDDILLEKVYIDLVIEKDNKVTMNFLSGTAVDRVAKCTIGERNLDCESPGLIVNITLLSGETREDDVLHFVKVYGGKTHILDMTRESRPLPKCK